MAHSNTKLIADSIASFRILHLCSPKDSPFYQQKLKAWQPILTPKWVIITFLLIGLPFVGIGFWLKSVSDNVVEYRYQYDGAGTDAKYSSCQMSNKTQYTVCNIIVDVAKEMKGPVFVYYELTNFYQNHRRYVKSKSEDQIQGKVGGTLSPRRARTAPLSCETSPRAPLARAPA